MKTNNNHQYLINKKCLTLYFAFFGHMNMEMSIYNYFKYYGTIDLFELYSNYQSSTLNKYGIVIFKKFYTNSNYGKVIIEKLSSKGSVEIKHTYRSTDITNIFHNVKMYIADQSVILNNAMSFNERKRKKIDLDVISIKIIFNMPAHCIEQICDLNCRTENIKITKNHLCIDNAYMHANVNSSINSNCTSYYSDDGNRIANQMNMNNQFDFDAYSSSDSQKTCFSNKNITTANLNNIKKTELDATNDESEYYCLKKDNKTISIDSIDLFYNSYFGKKNNNIDTRGVIKYTCEHTDTFSNDEIIKCKNSTIIALKKNSISECSSQTTSKPADCNNYNTTVFNVPQLNSCIYNMRNISIDEIDKSTSIACKEFGQNITFDLCSEVKHRNNNLNTSKSEKYKNVEYYSNKNFCDEEVSINDCNISPCINAKIYINSTEIAIASEFNMIRREPCKIKEQNSFIISKNDFETDSSKFYTSDTASSSYHLEECQIKKDLDHHVNKDLNNGKPYKIFIGGLPDISSSELAALFGYFGLVIDVIIIYNKQHARQKGFGFIVFKNYEAYEKCLKYKFLTIKNKLVEIKRARPYDIHITETPYKEDNVQLNDPYLIATHVDNQNMSLNLNSTIIDTILNEKFPWHDLN